MESCQLLPCLHEKEWNKDQKQSEGSPELVLEIELTVGWGFPWRSVMLFLQSGGRLTRYPTVRHINIYVSKIHIGVTVYLFNIFSPGSSSYGYLKDIIWVLGHNNFYAQICISLRCIIWYRNCFVYKALPQKPFCYLIFQKVLWGGVFFNRDQIFKFHLNQFSRKKGIRMYKLLCS